jgi:cytochrome c
MIAMTNKQSLIPLLLCFLMCANTAWGGDEQKETLADFQPTLSEEFKALLNEADPEAGEMIFMRKCSSCHDHEKDGGHGKGPHLWNVMGRKAAVSEGFEYSDAMRNSGHVWTFATLNYYLTSSDRAVPGLIMEFRGITKEPVRAKLLAFLRTLHDEPPALP